MFLSIKTLKKNCVFVKETLLNLKRLSASIENNSMSKIETTYEQPWDCLQTPLINNHLLLKNNRNGGSLQKLTITEQSKQQFVPSTPLLTSSCQHSEDIRRKIPINRYLYFIIFTLLTYCLYI